MEEAKSPDPMERVNITIDPKRRSMLRAASRTTRIPMSELVRLALDRLMLDLGDPECPRDAAVIRLLKESHSAS
jgi:hypothetical protein